MFTAGMKHTIRSLVAGFLFYSGIMFMLAPFRLRRRAVVLMYHRVLNPSEYDGAASQKGIMVTTGSFEKHMSFLKRHAHVISLSQFSKHIRDRIPFQNRSCLVTFDDGWEDNFRNALPILRKSQIPAVVFLPGDYVDTQKKFWQEDFLLTMQEIRRRFRTDSDLRKTVDSNPILDKISYIMKTDNDDVELEIQALINEVKKWTKYERDQFLASLKAIACQTVTPEANTVPRSFLNADEIRQMIEAGIEFGSHGMSHEILTNLSTEEIRKELSESREYLQRSFSIKADSFSYPNGNYNEMIIDMAKQIGYKVVFGTKNGYVQLGDDSYSIHRISIHEDMTRTIPLFFSKLLRLW